MQKIIEGIISASLIPIIVLNIVGGLIGAIWLFILGEWKLVIGAFIVSCIFPFAYSLIFLIRLPLIGITVWSMGKKNKILPTVLGFINLLFEHIINLTWVFAVFVSAILFSEGRNLIPYLLYGWVIAVGPFQYMARGEDADAVATHATVYLTQIAYIIFALFFLLGISFLALPLVILIAIALEVYLVRFSLQIQKLEEQVNP